MPLLIGRLCPYRVFFVCVVPRKGVHPQVVERLARFLNEAGLVQFSYRSDKEPSIIAMFEEACKLSGRQGNDATPADLKKIRDARPP